MKKSILLSAIFLILMAMGVSALTVTNPSTTVVEGYANTAVLSLTNNANTSVNVTLTATDLTSGNNTLAAGNITLINFTTIAANTTSDEVVTVIVPANTTLGTYTGTIITDQGVNATLNVVVRSAGVYMTIPTSVTIGNATTQERGETAVTQFNISNAGFSGDNSLTSIVVTGIANPRYQMQFSVDASNYSNSINIASIAVGTDFAVYVRAIIPEAEDAGLRDIANIQIVSNEITDEISNVYIRPENMLNITIVEVDVGGSTREVEEGVEISGEAEPGEKVDFEITFENLYTDSDDLELENVYVTLTIRDIDDNDDIEVESSDVTIKPEGDKTIDLSFYVPYRVDTTTYDILIEVESEDENNAEHTATFQTSMQVEKDTHDLRILKADFINDELKCLRSTRLDLEVMNLGDRFEEDGVIEVYSKGLGIDEKDDFEFENEADEDEIEFVESYDVDAEGLAPGTYEIEIRTYYSGNKLSDRETVELTVEECTFTTEKKIEEAIQKAEEVAPGLEQNEGIIVERGGAVAEELSGMPQTTLSSNSESIWDHKEYLVLLIAANTVLLIVGVFLIFKFLILPRD